MNVEKQWNTNPATLPLAFIFIINVTFGHFKRGREKINSKRKRELRRYCRMMQGEKDVETASSGGQEKRQTDRCVAYSQLDSLS